MGYRPFSNVNVSHKNTMLEKFVWVNFVEIEIRSGEQLSEPARSRLLYNCYLIHRAQKESTT